MKNILIWKKVAPGSEYDISFANSYESIQIALNSGTYNVGNRLWLQGLMSVIDTQENKYTFLGENFSPDYINTHFDLIIYPMANIFNKMYLHFIKSSAEEMSKIKIPVFVISCGAQAESYDALDTLIADIGEESKRFISAIYNTGGQFSLRGHFTNEFFKRLGFFDAVVTGCPSLYQRGRDFSVPLINRTKPLNPTFNGNLIHIKKLINAFPNSYFYDQDIFLEHLYKENYISSYNFKSLVAFYCNYGIEAAQLLGENRIRLIPEMSDWRNTLIQNNADYSFGSRIHGNIMSLLSGIPATVVANDSRTREMAEFFNIPLIVCSKDHIFSIDEFFETYEKADYSLFNKTYSQKFDAYSKFIIDNKIVTHLNERNRFFNDNDFQLPTTKNTDEFFKFYKKMKSFILPIKLCKQLLS